MTRPGATNQPRSVSATPAGVSPGRGDPALAVAQEFETLLDAMVGEYERLASAVSAQREAVRRADPAALARSIEAQSRGHARLAELDGVRRELAVRACGSMSRLAGIHPAKVTLREIAQAAPAQLVQGLLDRADRLRSAALAVQEQSRGVRAASESLAAHVEGLVRQVGRALSHAGVYGRRGVIEPGGVVVSALDVRM